MVLFQSVADGFAMAQGAKMAGGVFSKTVLYVGMLVIAAYLSIAWYRAHSMSATFEQISIGGTEASALAVLGDPSVREIPNKPFLRYATKPCRSPCVERLWFENRLLLDIEAWSVEVDDRHNIIRKTHWISP
jgi:hypothetical protein